MLSNNKNIGWKNFGSSPAANNSESTAVFFRNTLLLSAKLSFSSTRIASSRKLSFIVDAFLNSS
jgi:hypothetical protein